MAWARLARQTKAHGTLEVGTMTYELLIGTIALMLSTTLLTPGGDADDPHLWLEEVLGDKPLAWVKERNAESEGELARSAEFRSLEHRVLEILDSDARIPVVRKDRSRIIATISGATQKNPRGLWSAHNALDEYRKAKPSWEVVLDLDALGKEENVNWVWQGAQALKPEYKLALVSLSPRGADASVVREFDLTTKSFVNGGFTPSGGEESDFVARTDSVFVATDFGPGLV